MSDSILKHNIFSKYKIHHILFWILFFVFWMAIFSSVTINFWLNVQYTSSFVGMQIFSVYFTNHYLIPRFLYTKNYLKFITCFLALMMLTGSILITVDWFLFLPYRSPKESTYFWNLGNLIYGSFILVFFSTAAGGAIKFFVDQYKIQRALEKLMQEKSETELKFLKSQLNPHFIFNCLNNIYFLIDKGNEEARNYLLKFSEMLRYQLYDSNTEKIELAQEIKYLQNYVETQRIRKGANYQIIFNVDESLNKVKVAPLLMIPFVENAFKHVSNFVDKENLIDINLCRNNGSLIFEVINTKEKLNGKEFKDVGGIGLKNVTRRLELIYPGKHTLYITDSSADYTVKLKIDINEN